MKINIAVIGSVRKLDNTYQYLNEVERYERTSFELGRKLASYKNVNKYLLHISNDHLEAQSAPEWKSKGFKELKYKTEDTVDYMAMLGFLAYLIDNPQNAENRIKLFLSEEMKQGGPSPIARHRHHSVLGKDICRLYVKYFI